MIDVTVSREVAASPDRVRAIMFEPRNDPKWMAAVKSVEPQSTRTRWALASDVWARIIDGPMRGVVHYTIEPSPRGSIVSIRNIGDAPGFAPAPLLRFFMRRALTADLRRLEQVVGSAD
jgi:hypothetical protein